MQRREPWLYHEFIGRYEDKSAASAQEPYSERLLRRDREEAAAQAMQMQQRQQSQREGTGARSPDDDVAPVDGAADPLSLEERCPRKREPWTLFHCNGLMRICPCRLVNAHVVL